MIPGSVLEKYCALFLHHPEDYIRHSGNSWYSVKGPVTESMIASHLKHEIVIGLRPEANDHSLRWFALDFDAHNGENPGRLAASMLRIKEELKTIGIETHAEKSGRGFHLWVFVSEPVKIGSWLDDLKSFIHKRCEIYAGKTRIRVPMGVYQNDRSIFCGFIDENLRLFPDQFRYLLGIRPLEPAYLNQLSNIVLREAQETEIEPHSFWRAPIGSPRKQKRQFDTHNLLFHFEARSAINNIFSDETNAKHRLILYLGYALQLAPYNMVRMRCAQVDLPAGRLRITAPDGKKRWLEIPESGRALFATVLEGCAGNAYLLSGERTRYSTRSVQKVLERFAFKIGEKTKPD